MAIAFVYSGTSEMNVHVCTSNIASFVLKVNLPSSSGNSLQTSKVTPELENLGMQKLHQKSWSEDSRVHGSAGQHPFYSEGSRQCLWLQLTIYYIHRLWHDYNMFVYPLR